MLLQLLMTVVRPTCQMRNFIDPKRFYKGARSEGTLAGLGKKRSLEAPPLVQVLLC